MYTSKSTRKLFSKLFKEGWTCRYGKKHGKLISPTGHRVVFSKTPSDRNAIHNLTKDIRAVQRLEERP